MTTYFIGCDMGGWHTSRGDGLAICRWRNGTMESVHAEAGALYYPVASEASLAQHLTQALDEGARVVIAIDAALAWPVDFRDLVVAAPEAAYLPDFERQDGALQNRHLYRDTERFVHATTGKQPLTAPGDKFGNNSSKAQALTAWLAQHVLEADRVLYRPPFDEWDLEEARKATCTLIEAYPGASMMSPAFQRVTWPAEAPVTMQIVGNNDIADAKRCAVIGACYSATVGHLPGAAYPHVALCNAVTLGDTYAAERVRKEGWIFTPTRD